MQASIEKQRTAVRKVGIAGSTPTDSFFTVAWSGPSSLAPGALASAAQGDCEPVPKEELDRLIAKAAKEHGVQSALIRAVIQRESAGKACAVSAKGAQGIMQLMPGTQVDLGVANAFDATENVLGGARYLKQLLGRYDGDIRLALAAYNAGPNRVEPKGAIPDIPETKSYVTDIMAALQALTATDSK